MWYKDYKKQSYRINWQAVDAQGLKAAWLIDAPVSKFYDKCGDMVLKSPHPYIPYCNHFSCMDSLYGVSAPVCQSSVYYIDNNMNRILETTSGNNGYNREVELLSNFTESYSMFARFYYHPSFYATNGTGILTAFSNGLNDMPASIFVDASGFKFTADNGLHYASGTINLPEGWYDVWGIFDSGSAINTRLIVNGEEQHGTYTPAPIRPVNSDFIVAGDKGTGNNYWGTFSEIRFYNWPVPLGMAQYVYEPSNINSLYSLPEDDVFSSIIETNTTLYIPSRSGTNDNWTLFLKAPESLSKGSTLYTSGPIPWSGGANLYVHHDKYQTNEVKLFIHGGTLNSMFNGLNLSLYSGGDNIGSGEVGNIYDGIGLYIQNDQTSNPIPTGLMNLFITSYYDRLGTKTSMFIKGNAFEGATPGKSGYIPILEPINLYIFNNQSSTAVNNYIGLFIANDYSNSISLYTAGVIDVIGSGITFFMSGVMPMDNSATLFTHGF